jgi:CMP-N,N'-diacetyllegionaminic acid synthase
VIAFIPARGGSKRLPRKNIRLLGGHPLIAYSIAAAHDSGVFDAVYVSTEDAEIAAIARDYGAQVIERPPYLALDTSTDYEWLNHAIDAIGKPPNLQWALLRPTSPFRTAETIRRAWRTFKAHDTADSIRAVEPVTQHPGKMWTCEGAGYPIRPLLDKKHADGTPWHSSPTQSLPVYYVQNASLEMGWGANLWTFGTIHGRKVAPFFTEGYEGTDINSDRDWRYAEALLASGEATLPPVPVATLSATPWAV